MVKPSLERWRAGKAYVRVKAEKYQKMGLPVIEAKQKAKRAARCRIPSGVLKCCEVAGFLLCVAGICGAVATLIAAIVEMVDGARLWSQGLSEASNSHDSFTMFLASIGFWAVAHIAAYEVPHFFFMSGSEALAEADRVSARATADERMRMEGLEADRNLIAKFEKENRSTHD